MHSGLSLASNERLAHESANRDQVFQQYLETERKIKEALIDRNCGHKLTETELMPVSSNAKFENNQAYDVEQYEKQPLGEILEMYKPIEKEYLYNTEQESK